MSIRNDPQRNLPIYKWKIYKLLLSKAYGYACVSKNIANYCSNVFKKKQIYYTPNLLKKVSYSDEMATVFSKKLKEKKSSHRFLFIGRLTKQKDPLLAIKAFSTTKFVNSVTLTIVGNGPLHKEVSKLCNNTSSKSQINRISHCKDIFSLMQAHDTLVCTSQWEGLPNVVMEALQAGLHVVVPTYCLGAVERSKDLRIQVHSITLIL